MYCSKCGKEIHNDSIYCRYCGAKQNGFASSNFGHSIKKTTCSSCGAQMTINLNDKVATCEFCKQSYIIDDGILRKEININNTHTRYVYDEAEILKAKHRIRKGERIHEEKMLKMQNKSIRDKRRFVLILSGIIIFIILF